VHVTKSITSQFVNNATRKQMVMVMVMVNLEAEDKGEEDDG
jgi:hypothetical protein